MLFVRFAYIILLYLTALECLTDAPRIFGIFRCFANYMLLENLTLGRGGLIGTVMNNLLRAKQGRFHLA